MREAVEQLLELDYNAKPVDIHKWPIKAYNQRLGQTMCEACDHGVDLGEMIFVPVGEDGYGYYHPECVLKDKVVLDAFHARVLA